MANALLLNNSIFFELTVTNPEVSPPAVDDATVTVTVTDSNGAELTGQIWPLALPSTGENGLYKKTVPPISGLVNGENYKVLYDVTGADGLIGQFCSSVKAKGC
jgi:hypothetical protein